MRNLAAILLLAPVLLFAAACGDDGDEDTGATATGTAAVTVAASPDSSDSALDDALDEYIDALGDRARDRIRDLMHGQLRERLRDHDFDRFHSCIPEGATVRMVARSVSVTDDTRTVTMTMEITMPDGTTSEVEHVVTFTRDEDGHWRLSELPDCPLQ